MNRLKHFLFLAAVLSILHAPFAGPDDERDALANSAWVHAQASLLDHNGLDPLQFVADSTALIECSREAPLTAAVLTECQKPFVKLTRGGLSSLMEELDRAAAAGTPITFPHILSFEVRGLMLRGAGMSDFFKAFSHIRAFSFPHSAISPDLIDVIVARCPNVEVLSFHNSNPIGYNFCALIGFGANSRHLATLPNLRFLDLSGHVLKEADAEYLLQNLAPRLTYLGLSENFLSRAFLKRWEADPRLEHLPKKAAWWPTIDPDTHRDVAE